MMTTLAIRSFARLRHPCVPPPVEPVSCGAPPRSPSCTARPSATWRTETRQVRAPPPPSSWDHHPPPSTDPYCIRLICLNFALASHVCGASGLYHEANKRTMATAYNGHELHARRAVGELGARMLGMLAQGCGFGRSGSSPNIWGPGTKHKISPKFSKIHKA